MHVPDAQTFSCLRFDPRAVRQVSALELAAIPEGNSLPSLVEPDRPSDRDERNGLATQMIRGTSSFARWAIIMGVFVFLAVAVLAIMILPTNMVNLHGLTASERDQSVASARSSLVQMIAGSAVFLGFLFTLETIRINRFGIAASYDSQIAERYFKSLEALSIDNPVEVRLGGIVSLERIALTSPLDRLTITRLLSIILRRANHDVQGESNSRDVSEIEAAVSALSAIRGAGFPSFIDLRGAALKNVQLEHMALCDTDLSSSIIVESALKSVDFRRAVMLAASVKNVDLRFSDLSRTMAREAVFENTDLSWCDLRGTVFISALLIQCSLVGARLEGCVFIGTDMRGADLRSTDLSGSLLLHVQLGDARADQKTRWPDGFDPLAAGVRYS